MIEMLKKRYRIIKRLGEGGMSDVYLAEDTMLNREVAIKVLRGKLAEEPVALLRFQREAQAASAIHHNNIVEIYDVGEEEGNHYIVMEYIRGKTLKQLISDRGALDLKEAMSIMGQLMEAITQAHKNSIIHRDIKPQNVLIKDDGTVKITDFGIATVSDALQLTQQDTVLGSVHYIAPELVRGESASQQSDIYSLGICFYELLTGQVPYRGESPVQIAMKHLKDELPSVREINPSLPQSIENIILKAGAKNKQHRYLNVLEMKDELDHALENKSVAKIEFESDEEVKTIVMDVLDNQSEDKKKSRLKPWVWPASALGIIVLFYLIVTVLTPALTTVKVPELIGKTKEEAEELLQNTGIELSRNIQYTFTDDMEKGLIYRVSPPAGTEIEKGSTISITISEGMYYVMPDFVGKTLAEAEESLKETRVNIRKDSIATEDYPPYTITDQSVLLPGTKVNPTLSYEVKFVIAVPPEFTIPAVEGLPIDQARAQIEALGGIVTMNQLSTDDMSEEELYSIVRGVVISTNPGQLTFYRQENNNRIVINYY